MKKTIQSLYHINPKAFIKYSDKVYKVKSENEEEYCLKYVNHSMSSNVNEKMQMLHLCDCFVMPLKTSQRTTFVSNNNQSFLLAPWVEDDMVDSKDLKVKYYLSQIGKLHQKSSYTLNVSSSFFKELTMEIEENIEECYQKYESIMSNIEHLEYKSPFQWYFVEQFRYIINGLDRSREHLNKLKELVKNKASIREVIVHQNFSYDHIFITKDKIIGNEKMKMSSPVYEFDDLFNKIEFGSIDLSGMFDEYLKYNQLEDYEIQWLLSILFISPKLKIIEDDFKNMKSLMNVIFKYKSVCELEKKLAKN